MINKLVDKIKKTEAPIVVGLDPMMKFIPEHITKAAFAEHGETLEGAAEAIWQYNKAIVDNIYDLIPCVKPQIAMYEQFGIPGLVAYKKTIEYCKSKDLVVIGDIKRGDIGSTSEAYAVGHLGKVQVGSNSFYSFDEDFATLAPYMGSDSINPFKKVCQEEKKGLFILVKTSNPSSGEFQDRLIEGRPLYEWVAEKVVEWGSDFMGDSYSYVGAVVGATYPEMGKVLRELMPKSFILVPGYGAQGGKGADLVHFFSIAISYSSTRLSITPMLLPSSRSRPTSAVMAFCIICSVSLHISTSCTFRSASSSSKIFLIDILLFSDYYIINLLKNQPNLPVI